MLEKFYFESFLIAFSAIIGALSSYIISWTIKESKMDNLRKIIFILFIFFITILIVGLILFIIIFIIGYLSN